MDKKQTDGSREDSKLPTLCALWPVGLKITHTDCKPGNTLVHFQGQYATTCELDYNILQVEIQNVHKEAISVEVGDVCLVEDLLSSHWFRGRIKNKSQDLFSVFLLDRGNIITVGPNNLSAIPDSLLILPPKIVCGFIANVLPFQEYWDQPSKAYFSSLIGKHIEGYIHGILPYKILILEVPEITKDLLGLRLGRHVDTDTFLFLVELELDVTIQQSCESVPDLLIEKQTALEISFKTSHLCDYRSILSLSDSKLAVGQMEKVRISAAVNSGLFYCQLFSAAKDLKEMSKKMALVSELKSGDYRDNPGENMGLLCAVKGKDEKWHRGFVQCLPLNSQVQVLFVDFGYCESVKVEDIFQLPSDFLLRPVMAFPCSLSCLRSKDQVNQQQKQLDLLRNGLLGMELVLTIDDISKGKYVCSVTLANVDDCAPIKPLKCKEVDQVIGCGTDTNVHQSVSRMIGTKKVEISIIAFEEIQDGAVFEGCVAHVQSPHDFWMRSAKYNDRFKVMMDKLKDWFSRLPLNEQTLQDPVPGQLCCAMYEKDMHYYRAVVVDILKYGAKVFFIDFGNTEKVPSMLIKKIPSEFSVEPMFAFHCSLAHVVSLEDEWTSAAKDFFRKATSDKALLVHVICRKGNLFAVEMYEKGVEKSESVATLLAREKMAMYWTYSVVNTLGTPAGKNNKMKNIFSKRQLAKNSSQKLFTKATRQETNKYVDKQVNTEAKKMNEREMFKVQKFRPGTVINVRCSHISSASDFWCQNKKYKFDLDRLMESLQLFYQSNTSFLQPQSVCCAVRLQIDNKWYRGCIFEETDLNVRVILVDYGIVVQENIQNLRALNPEFLKLEGQAFRCSLYNVTDRVDGDVWSNKAKTLLKDFTSGNSDLKCKIYSHVYVINKGFCNMVDLYTPFQQASTLLTERGIGKKIQSLKQLFPYVYPCSFVYSSFDIIIGSEELVFPTYVVSPWEIYLQLNRNSEIIEHLMDRTTKESEELMSKTHTKLEFAHDWLSVCLAKYSEDGKWYRSFVWPAQSSLHVNVFFVDYGGKEVAEKRNVLSIPLKAEDLLLTPMQALRCSLLNVPEEEQLPEVNSWLEKAILNKELRAKFVATNSSGHFLCDLFDCDVHINEKVRDIFAVHRQQEQSVRKPNSSCCKEWCLVDNKFKIDQRPHVESMVKSRGASSHSKVIKENGQSCQQISSKVKSSKQSHHGNGTSAKNVHGKEKHRLKPKEIHAIEKVQSCKRLPSLSDLPANKITPGFRCTGFISHCESFKSFFIQMEKDEQNILKMREELNSSPFTESLQTVASNIKVGHLVAARYEEDLALYRATVKGVTSSGSVTVEFVDYGNTATVDKKEIRQLASKFLSEARLSTHCTLSKRCNQDNFESLLSDANDQTLMVEFLQNLGCAWEVSIRGLESEANIPNSDRAKQSQKQNAAVDEEGFSLTGICKMTEKETTIIKEGTKRLEPETKNSKKVKKKTSTKKSKRGRGDTQKLRPNKKESTHKCEKDKKRDEFQSKLPLPIDLGAIKNKLLNILEHTAPMAIPSKTVMDQNAIRRLFLAPVNLDHEYSGFAAAVTTPGKFNIVLEDLVLVMIAVSNILEELPEDLAPLPETCLIPGSGCLLMSEERRKWCRAEIVQRDHKSVIVNLVDYGYCVDLPCQDVSRLKGLPDELASFPKLTFPCLLRGIKPNVGLQWSDQAALFFQQCLCQNNLNIHFRQFIPEAQWVVDVSVSNRNVAKELIDAGHAQYIDTVLGEPGHQGLGHKRSHSVENVYKAVTGTHKPTQSEMDEVQQRHSEVVLSNNDAIFEGCSTKEENEVPFSENSDQHQHRK